MLDQLHRAALIAAIDAEGAYQETGATIRARNDGHTDQAAVDAAYEQQCAAIEAAGAAWTRYVSACAEAGVEPSPLHGGQGSYLPDPRD